MATREEARSAGSRMSSPPPCPGGKAAAEGPELARAPSSAATAVMVNQLKSEGPVTPERLALRQALVAEMNRVPDDFLAYFQILNLESGCRHRCALCSQEAGTAVTAFTRDGLEDTLSALLTVATARRARSAPASKEPWPLIGYGFRTYRPGLVKLYYDNDSGESLLLYDAIKHLYENFGLRSRLSMVAYSRGDAGLQSMHEAIVRNHAEKVDSVRFSFSTHPVGWRRDRSQYLKDFANMLRTWKPFVDQRRGSGRYHGSITEFRMDPDVEVSDQPLEDIFVSGRHVVRFGPTVLVSREERDARPDFNRVVGANGRSPIFERPPSDYSLIVSDELIRGDGWRSFIERIICEPQIGERTTEKRDRLEGHPFAVRSGGLVRLANSGGEFYAFEPTFRRDGIYEAVNVYPKTAERRVSGIFEETRWCLNALLRYKAKIGIARRAPFSGATWDDVERFLGGIRAQAGLLGSYNRRASAYVEERVLPLVRDYVEVLRLAGFGPEFVFDPNFTYFAGPLYNMGRAMTLFKGLASRKDDPMTAAELREYYLTYRFEPPSKISPVPLIRPGEIPDSRLTGSKVRRGAGGEGAIVFEQLDRLNAMRPTKSIYISGLAKLRRGDSASKSWTTAAGQEVGSVPIKAGVPE